MNFAATYEIRDDKSAFEVSTPLQATSLYQPTIQHPIKQGKDFEEESGELEIGYSIKCLAYPKDPS